MICFSSALDHLLQREIKSKYIANYIVPKRFILNCIPLVLWEQKLILGIGASWAEVVKHAAILGALALWQNAAHLTWTPADPVISWSTDGDLTLITHHSPTAWHDSDSIVMTWQWFDGITDSSPQLSEDEKGKQGHHIFLSSSLGCSKFSLKLAGEEAQKLAFALLLSLFISTFTK